MPIQHKSIVIRMDKEMHAVNHALAAHTVLNSFRPCLLFVCYYYCLVHQHFLCCGFVFCIFTPLSVRLWLSSLLDICPHDVQNDIDADGVCGDLDNCPTVANSNQVDADADALG